jgi:predicted phage-related endonuclease
MRHPLDDHSAEWHEKRLAVIGGSDANKIMAGEWRDLWLVKTGREKGDDLSDILAVQMGSYTEALNLAWFKKQTGMDVRTTNCAHLVHPLIPYMGANLDGRIPLNSMDLVFEAKHTNSSMNIDKAVSRYYPQLQHQMTVIGASQAFLSCFFGNSKWDFATVKFDDDYVKVLMEWEQEFWHHVTSDTEPEDRPGYGKKIDTSTLKTVDMEGNNEWADSVVTYVDTLAAASSHEDARKTLKGMVPADVGEAHGHGIRIKRSTNKSLRIYEEKIA